MSFDWQAVADPPADERRRLPTSHPSTSWIRLGGRFGATALAKRKYHKNTDGRAGGCAQRGRAFTVVAKPPFHTS